jgi:hypothetical protein
MYYGTYGKYIHYLRIFFLVPSASTSASLKMMFSASSLHLLLAYSTSFLGENLSLGIFNYMETMDNVCHGLYHHNWSSGNLCGMSRLFATSWATLDALGLL